MLYQAYWRNNDDRLSHHGFVKADSHDEAYDIVTKNLQKGYYVTAVYEAHEHQITPQAIKNNFPNTTDYHLF